MDTPDHIVIESDGPETVRVPDLHQAKSRRRRETKKRKKKKKTLTRRWNRKKIKEPFFAVSGSGSLPFAERKEGIKTDLITSGGKQRRPAGDEDGDDLVARWRVPHVTCLHHVLPFLFYYILYYVDLNLRLLGFTSSSGTELASRASSGSNADVSTNYWPTSYDTFQWDFWPLVPSAEHHRRVAMKLQVRFRIDEINYRVG